MKRQFSIYADNSGDKYKTYAAICYHPNDYYEVKYSNNLEELLHVLYRSTKDVSREYAYVVNSYRLNSDFLFIYNQRVHPNNAKEQFAEFFI